MAEVTVYEVVDAGEDVLIVRGTVDGEKAEATGWVSALINHVDSQPEEGAELGESWKPKTRALNAEEKRAYCEALLAPASVEQPVTGIKLDPEPEPEEAPAE